MRQRLLRLGLGLGDATATAQVRGRYGTPSSSFNCGGKSERRGGIKWLCWSVVMHFYSSCFDYFFNVIFFLLRCFSDDRRSGKRKTISTRRQSWPGDVTPLNTAAIQFLEARRTHAHIGNFRHKRFYPLLTDSQAPARHMRGSCLSRACRWPCTPQGRNCRRNRRIIQSWCRQRSSRSTDQSAPRVQPPSPGALRVQPPSPGATAPRACDKHGRCILT